MESEALSHFSTWPGLICQNSMKLVMLRLMTEIPALNFIITVKRGRKILDYKRISDWCKKRNDLRHFEIPRVPFEFPLVLILSPSMLSRLSLLFGVSKNSRDSLPCNPRELHTTYLELSCWNKFPFTNAIGEPVNGHKDYCVSYCCRFQGIHTTLITYLARKNHVGRTSIKVTTHSSSKSLDFLCKYFKRL